MMGLWMGCLVWVGADSLDPQALFRSARWDIWRGLSERRLPYAYVVQTRTEQLDAQGRVIAWEERQVRRFYVRGQAQREVLAERRQGTFDWGIPARSRPSASGEPGQGPLSLGWTDSSEGGLIRPRDEPDYAFRLIGSGSVGDVPVHVLEASVKPHRASRHELKRARLYLEPNTRRVVAVELQLERRSLLLDLDVELRTELTRLGEEAWVPAKMVSAIRYKLPLRAWRFVRVTSSYRDYTPVRAEDLPAEERP
ncbi:MAG: hypothetical protein N2561_01295 [Bacteroidetes bacterium]|nr:hypothetical protein [Rhodothermia bacterium]MCS7155739.1 hypothetical protein [Bacteroidota bacterium]MCX7906160.1 hypothetical protein [Bacteroidota bacterium]MDW8138288.1 hypothetical protein [Bacteroidota bacterium]MDW8285972.1 hypothetical protein [Bacteroidota bacterium]